MPPLLAVALNAGVGLGGPFLETDVADEVALVEVRSSTALPVGAAGEVTPRLSVSQQGAPPGPLPRFCFGAQETPHRSS